MSYGNHTIRLQPSRTQRTSTGFNTTTQSPRPRAPGAAPRPPPGQLPRRAAALNAPAMAGPCAARFLRSAAESMMDTGQRLVNGEAVIRDGEHTGATPGRAVWGPGRKDE